MSLTELSGYVLNGLGVGIIYFLIALGLTIIFGIMNFVNFAHGAFFMLGAYLLLTVSEAVGSFWVGLLAAPVGVGVLALILERVLLRPLYGVGHEYQIVLTFGLAVAMTELIILAWGPEPHNIAPPGALAGTVTIAGLTYPSYRLFVIGAGVTAAILIWLVLERTRIGATVRAGTESIEMVSCLGVNIQRLFAATMSGGAALAALGGGLAAPIQGVTPSMGDAILGLAFVVVVLGGMGTFAGALVAAVVIGVVQSLTIAIVSAAGSVVVYLLMAAVLVLRPGLMGREVAK